MESPLHVDPLLHLGPVPVTPGVAVTWAIMALLALGAGLARRRLRLRPGGGQAALELLVESVDGQIREITGADPAPFRAFIGTLFVFILCANWSALVPGVEPPTAELETDAALAGLVFLAVAGFGLRGGARGYLRSFAAPNPAMIPLNMVESVTRVFSMFVRLFGNVMSGVFVIGIVASLAGLLVPIPLMALDLLTGLVQAYIFAILAAVFIAATLEEARPPRAAPAAPAEAGHGAPPARPEARGPDSRKGDPRKGGSRKVDADGPPDGFPDRSGPDGPAADAPAPASPASERS